MCLNMPTYRRGSIGEPNQKCVDRRELGRTGTDRAQTVPNCAKRPFRNESVVEARGVSGRTECIQVLVGQTLEVSP